MFAGQIVHMHTHFPSSDLLVGKSIIMLFSIQIHSGIRALPSSFPPTFLFPVALPSLRGLHCVLPFYRSPLRRYGRWQHPTSSSPTSMHLCFALFGCMWGHTSTCSHETLACPLTLAPVSLLSEPLNPPPPLQLIWYGFKCFSHWPRCHATYQCARGCMCQDGQQVLWWALMSEEIKRRDPLNSRKNVWNS